MTKKKPIFPDEEATNLHTDMENNPDAGVGSEDGAEELKNAPLPKPILKRRCQMRQLRSNPRVRLARSRAESVRRMQPKVSLTTRLYPPLKLRCPQLRNPRSVELLNWFKRSSQLMTNEQSKPTRIKKRTTFLT